MKKNLKKIIRNVGCGEFVTNFDKTGQKSIALECEKKIYTICKLVAQ